MKERDLANHILDHFGMSNDDRPDLTRIAQIQGINVQYVPYIDGDASGWFRENDGNPIIEISSNKAETHQRFTFAHELGHYFMNHGDRARDTYQQFRLREPEEISANRFAAELLMPKAKVERFLDEGLSQSEMANRFGVSHESMGYRLNNLGYEYDREYTF